MTELKPCPFCGQIPEFFRDDRYFGVECANPFCSVMVKVMYRLTEEEAIEAWNRRASE